MRTIPRALAPYRVSKYGPCAAEGCGSLGAWTPHRVRLCKAHEAEYDEMTLAAFEDHWEFGHH